jgi:flagellar operon protein
MSIELNPALLPPGTATASPAPTAPSGPATTRPATTAPHAAKPGAPSGPSFADVLDRAAATQGLRFSKHALTRLQRRGIPLDPATLTRLEDGVGRAAGKGSRDSVVLVDGTAFVVSVNNRTVVTAVNPEHMREHVFTNIDSAVLA